jgi:hypothetical protein
MERWMILAIYVVATAAVIVGVDFAFFRNRFWERLMVNIGIVLVFGAFYLRFFMRGRARSKKGPLPISNRRRLSDRAVKGAGAKDAAD